MSDFTLFYTDDDYDDLSMFADALECIGKKISLHTFDSADKLLKTLQNQPIIPNILFLDLNMPGKNGFDVLEVLRSDKNQASIPVIVYSTAMDNAVIKQCLEAGANYFMTKPILMQDLVECIEYALSIDWKHFKANLNNFVYKGPKVKTAKNN
ncbi:response regulator [Flavobacterium psychroterrae]|uniref:Response regulator n=1 Tax=Flavobacterium psychroterrae TaxID=2133767 RepID=A0ABS5P554_9FLAO|nr:response regulator [Flavobacterium psychroterrae]MBS7229410.1 response regulator [Flavobacterium psychroterrae]